MTSSRHHLDVSGSFDLRQSAQFGFGQRDGVDYAGTMTLAMCLDGYDDHAAVLLRPAAGGLEAEVVGGDPEVAVRQAARVLSVDVDGRGWDDLCRGDDLLRRLQPVRPGLRPPLFHSVYEAVTWSVLATRRPLRQAARLRERISAEHGRVLEVAGQRVSAFPTPEALLRVRDVPGLPEVAVGRLHAAAEEARAGGLDTETLRSMTPDDAAATVRRLPGIGPFYSELVVVRTLGHTDVLPTQEGMVREVAGALTDREPLDQRELEALAERWRPWRTWAAVTVRACGPALLEQQRAGV